MKKRTVKDKKTEDEKKKHQGPKKHPVSPYHPKRHLSFCFLAFGFCPSRIFQESTQTFYVHDFVLLSWFTAFGGLPRLWHHLLKPLFLWLPQAAASHNPLGPTTPWPLPLPILLSLCPSFKFVESISPILDCFRQAHYNHSVCIGTLLREFCGWQEVGWGRGCACMWVGERLEWGAPKTTLKSTNAKHVWELGKDGRPGKRGPFILMLLPLGLVVRMANTNKPSCWHVLASLPHGYDVGHVRVEPAAEGRRALRVQCREGCCCHCRDTGERHLRTDWHARFEDSDREDAKSATCYSEKIPLDNCLPAFEAIVDKAKSGSSQILNMRAQYTLHSVVAIWRKTYKSDKGIFSYLPDFIHKIFQEMCDETAKLRCGAVRALAPIVELHEVSRIPIVEFYSGFVSVSFRNAWASSEWTHLLRTSWRRALACGSWMLCPSWSWWRKRQTMLSGATTKATTWQSFRTKKEHHQRAHGQVRRGSTPNLCRRQTWRKRVPLTSWSRGCRRKSWLRKRNDLLRGFPPLELGQKAVRRRSQRVRLTMSLARFGCTKLSWKMRLPPVAMTAAWTTSSSWRWCPSTYWVWPCRRGPWCGQRPRDQPWQNSRHVHQGQDWQHLHRIQSRAFTYGGEWSLPAWLPIWIAS